MWADWLVFRACGFKSVCHLMEKDKRLMEASWWGRLRRKLGLVLMDKSLIPFSVERQGCVPWGQTMVEVRKIMTTSFKKSHACTATLSAPNPAAGHRQPTPPLETLDTHGQVWVSLLWGHCSFLLGPGVQKVLFVPSQSLFPQSCVSPGSSVVG